MTTHLFQLPVCERCGGPVREQRCDPIDRTRPGDAWVTMVPGPTYNVPCGCVIRPGRVDCPGCTGDPADHPHHPPGRVTITDRTPSGEHTSADTDDVIASIDAAVEEWETLDGARWSPDGSHEHDPSPWTRMNLGVQQGQADWGCDDVAERMRPGSTACFPWASYRLRDSEPVRAPWADYEPSRDLAERRTRASWEGLT